MAASHQVECSLWYHNVSRRRLRRPPPPNDAAGIRPRRLGAFRRSASRRRFEPDALVQRFIQIGDHLLGGGACAPRRTRPAASIPAFTPNGGSSAMGRDVSPQRFSTAFRTRRVSSALYPNRRPSSRRRSMRTPPNTTRRIHPRIYPSSRTARGWSCGEPPTRPTPPDRRASRSCSE